MQSRPVAPFFMQWRSNVPLHSTLWLSFQVLLQDEGIVPGQLLGFNYGE